MLITLAEIEAAQRRIAGVAVRTPLVRLDPNRLRAAGFTPPPFALYLKVESAQPIGSFKLRGAYNMAAQLTPPPSAPPASSPTPPATTPRVSPSPPAPSASPPSS